MKRDREKVAREYALAMISLQREWELYMQVDPADYAASDVAAQHVRNAADAVARLARELAS
jgi:hypothetical protein